MPEIDINKVAEVKPDFKGGIQMMKFDPEKWEVFQTDVNLKSVIFFNPIYWLKFKIFTGGPAGFGFWIGPLLLAVEIVQLVKPKENNL